MERSRVVKSRTFKTDVRIPKNWTKECVFAVQYTCPQRKVYMALGFCWTLVTVSTRMSNPTTLQFGAKTWVSSLPAYWGRSTSHKCPLFKMVPSPFKAFWLDSFYLWLNLFKLQNTELQNLTVNSNNSNFNMEGGEGVLTPDLSDCRSTYVSLCQGMTSWVPHCISLSAENGEWF